MPTMTKPKSLITLKRFFGPLYHIQPREKCRVLNLDYRRIKSGIRSRGTIWFKELCLNFFPVKDVISTERNNTSIRSCVMDTASLHPLTHISPYKPGTHR
jgi:hypothetical protein